MGIVAIAAVSILDWHRTLGHESAASIKLMARQSLANGLSVNPADGKADCESYIYAKQTLMHHRKPSRPTCEPLELICLELNGWWNAPSLPVTQAGEIDPIPKAQYNASLVETKHPLKARRLAFLPRSREFQSRNTTPCCHE